ncbi:MAG: T9SS type A sorting domain-containing protein, partial [Bacteroidota bacterium]|nr:T9SS type A sorting domain-containing protein [Bacteroidota bacterium]
TDTRARSNDIIHYRIMAKDSDETSGYSNQVSVRPADVVIVKPTKIMLSESISMYPNPASDKLTISTNMSITEPLNFQIFDMKGNMYRSFEITSGNSTREIDVSQLNDGIYILKVTNSEASVSFLLQVRP